MHPSTNRVTNTKRRRTSDTRKCPDGGRKRAMPEYARLARRRAIETLEETMKQNNKLLAKLAKRPIRHFKRSAAEIIRKDRESH